MVIEWNKTHAIVYDKDTREARCVLLSFKESDIFTYFYDNYKLMKHLPKKKRPVPLPPHQALYFTSVTHIKHILVCPIINNTRKRKGRPMFNRKVVKECGKKHRKLDPFTIGMMRVEIACAAELEAV